MCRSKCTMYNVQTQNGQSLLEVIIAVTVGILVVSALSFAVIYSLRNANLSKASAQATKLAQEGIERVRTGRDRSSSIIGIPPVTSWTGNGGPGTAIWDYQINVNCTPTCYFNISSAGVLSYVLSPASAESIPPNFKRVVILSDESTTYYKQKTVIVIVTWKDFSGEHESRLTTFLRKL